VSETSPTISASGTTPGAEPYPKRWLALAVIAVTVLMVILDATIVNIALPAVSEDLGLTPRSHSVLMTAMEGEQTQSEIAQQIGLDKTTMVVTMDELEAAGLAERRPSKTDRRARVIAVTRAGQAKAAEGRELAQRVQEEILAGLPARERDALLSGLTRLVSDRLATPVECQKAPRRRAPRAVA